MGRRWRAKYGNPDRNQGDLVKLARRLGCKVRITTRTKSDEPDLLCAFQGRTFVVEVKKPGEELTAGQEAFRDTWPGEYHVWRTGDDVIATLHKPPKLPLMFGRRLTYSVVAEDVETGERFDLGKGSDVHPREARDRGRLPSANPLFGGADREARRRERASTRRESTPDF